LIDACVVDASVGIKLFIEEEGSADADRLFARLGAESAARFYVPDLFFVECANVLWKYVRNYGYSSENARKDIRDLQSLHLLTVSTADLLPKALDLALAHDLPVYDACYLALAEQLQLPLITADGGFARKLKDSGTNVQLLGSH
jgi:predicted nucleic acid-binding protein